MWEKETGCNNLSLLVFGLAHKQQPLHPAIKKLALAPYFNEWTFDNFFFNTWTIIEIVIGVGDIQMMWTLVIVFKIRSFSMADVEGSYRVIRRHLGSPFHQIWWLSCGLNMFVLFFYVANRCILKVIKMQLRFIRTIVSLVSFQHEVSYSLLHSPCGLIRVLKV